MSRPCSVCGSYAINPHLYDRDGSDLDLCDVHYWQKRVVDLSQFRDAVVHAYGVVVPEEYCEKLGELLDLVDGKEEGSG